MFLKELSKYGATLYMWTHSLALRDLDLAGAGIDAPTMQR
jgi:hypothetical protein